MWAGTLTAVARVLSAIFSWVGLAFAWVAGYRKAQGKQAQQALKHAKEAAEIDERVDNLSGADRRKWLYGDPPD